MREFLSSGEIRAVSVSRKRAMTSAYLVQSLKNRSASSGLRSMSDNARSPTSVYSRCDGRDLRATTYYAGLFDKAIGEISLLRPASPNSLDGLRSGRRGRLIIFVFVGTHLVLPIRAAPDIPILIREFIFNAAIADI